MELVPIPGFEGLYSITREGKIWREPKSSGNGHQLKGKWAKLSSNSFGYLFVSLSYMDRKYLFAVHKLVLETFVGSCPVGMECCHNNGICTDNRVENLRWDTRLSNHLDAMKHGTCLVGEKHSGSKLTEQQVRQIIYEHRTNLFSGVNIGKQFGVSSSQISNIIHGVSWKHIWRCL